MSNDVNVCDEYNQLKQDLEGFLEQKLPKFYALDYESFSSSVQALRADGKTFSEAPKPIQNGLLMQLGQEFVDYMDDLGDPAIHEVRPVFHLKGLSEHLKERGVDSWLKRNAPDKYKKFEMFDETVKEIADAIPQLVSAYHINEASERQLTANSFLKNRQYSIDYFSCISSSADNGNYTLDEAHGGLPDWRIDSFIQPNAPSTNKQASR